MVQQLIEAGFEPLNIAAAAIKIARGDEKQRPIAEIADVKAEAPRKFEKDYGRGPRGGPIKREFGKSRRVSHEEGMVRMKLNKAKPTASARTTSSARLRFTPISRDT